MRRGVRVFVRWFAPFGAFAALCLSLANCANNNPYGVSASARLVAPGEPVPKGGGVYHVGQPYTVGGHVYVPEENPHYSVVGVASWYGEDFHGRGTANGEIFDADSISAAHPTLPLPSYARVTNLSNGRSIIVRINDRGPYAANRIIDVSRKTAHLLGFTVRGTAWVRVEYVGHAPIQGSDDRVLEATLRQGTPAPAPGDVQLASASPVPSFPPQPAATPSQASTQRYASAGTPAGNTVNDAAPTFTPSRAAPAVSYADPGNTPGGNAVLNGRGLY
jgi:rare lipoprotein A